MKSRFDKYCPFYHFSQCQACVYFLTFATLRLCVRGKHEEMDVWRKAVLAVLSFFYHVHCSRKFKASQMTDCQVQKCFVRLHWMLNT